MPAPTSLQTPLMPSMAERVVVGIGATSSATAEECLEAIRRVVASNWVIVAVATIAGKELLIESVADELGVPWSSWPADRLDRLDVPDRSDFVREVTGSASVAEAAALLASEGGCLLVGKVRDGAFTVAVASFDVNTGARASGGALCEE